MLLRNLRAVVTNYTDVGVRYSILSGTVSARPDVEAMREILPVPMRVVRLTLSLDEIKRRLSSDPTSGRRDDLAEAARQIERDEGHVGRQRSAHPRGGHPDRRLAGLDGLTRSRA